MFRWVIKGIFLFLSFCGFATVYSYHHGYAQVISDRTLQGAWVFGVCGLIFLALTFMDDYKNKKKKRNG